MAFTEILNIVVILATIVGVVGGYFAFRGRQFGLPDLLIFLPLAAAADWLSFLLYQTVASSRGESSAYLGLAALLGLLGLVPIAIGLSIVALVAIVVGTIRYPAIRFGLLGFLALLWLLPHNGTGLTENQVADSPQHNDRLAGENWALESGAQTKTDCDRQSKAGAFREGCYSQIKR